MKQIFERQRLSQTDQEHPGWKGPREHTDLPSSHFGKLGPRQKQWKEEAEKEPRPRSSIPTRQVGLFAQILFLQGV